MMQPSIPRALVAGIVIRTRKRPDNAAPICCKICRLACRSETQRMFDQQQLAVWNAHNIEQ